MFRYLIIICIFAGLLWALGPVPLVLAESAGPALAQAEEQESDSSGPALSSDEEDQESQQQEDTGPALGADEEAEASEESEQTEESEEPAEEEELDLEDIEGDEQLLQELKRLRERVDQLEQEAEARETLRMSEEEERDQEEDVLEAAGREYSLLQRGLLSLDLNMDYSYYSSDMIRESFDVEYRSNHNLNNSLSIETGLRDNLTVGGSVPFVYKYDKQGTDQARDMTDLGDISLELKYQPFKAGKRWPSPIFNTNLSLPTGRGEYEINPNQELSTGSGLYELSAGVSASKPIDPVNVFGSLNYRYRFDQDNIGQRLRDGLLQKVEPGNSISANLGFGYSISYRVALSLSLSYSYGFSNTYHFADGNEDKSGDSVSSSLSLSTSWRISPKRSIIVGVNKGLTNDSSDFGLSLRVPIEFDLR